MRFLSGAQSFLAAILMLGASSALALKPAVPNHLPRDPRTVISIPDCKAFWESANASPLAGKISQYLSSEAFMNTAQFGLLEAQIEEIEENSGISLWPNTLMTETLSGVDLTLAERDNRSHALWAFSFRNEGDSQKVLTKILADAKNAKGVSGGFAADTVDTHQDRGRTIHVLPAFEMFLSEADSTTLLVSTNEKLLISGLQGEGAGFLTTDYFQAHLDGIGKITPQLWAIGDLGSLGTMAKRLAPEQVTAVPVADESKGMLALQFNAASINVSMFNPTSQMLPNERRIALAAPAPGSIDALKFFDPGSMFVYTTNYFDGLLALDQMRELASDMADVGVNGDRIDEIVSQSRDMFGFDIKTDLLANIGPDMGFAMQDLVIPDGTTTDAQPKVDVLFAVRVRNQQRIQLVFDAIEANFQDPPILEVEAYGDLEIKTVNNPMLSAFNLIPSYTVTADNYFLFALTPESLTSAIDRAASGKVAILEAAGSSEARRHLDPQVNSWVVIPGSGLQRAFSSTRASIKDMTGGATSEEQLEQLHEWLSLVKVIATTTTYLREGKKTQLVLGM